MYTIRRIGNTCSLSPWWCELEPLLTFHQRDFDRETCRINAMIRKRRIDMDDPNLKMRSPYTFKKQQLFSCENGCGVFMAGLLDRVLNFLDEHKAPYKLLGQEERRAAFAKPDFSRLDKLRKGQDKIILAVCANDGGMIVGGTGVGKSFLLGQLCKVFPLSRIIICSTRVSVVKALYKHVLDNVDESEVGYYEKGEAASRKRIFVTTSTSLGKADLDNADFLFYDEAHNVGNNTYGEKVVAAHKARRYGFTASDTRSDGSELCMEAAFGPVICEIPYDEAVENGMVVPIRVMMVDTPFEPGRQIEKSDYPEQNMRRHYWDNPARNKRIQTLARCIPEDEQVLIMVDKVEHAIHLGRLLPEYRLAFASTSASNRVIGRGKDKVHVSDFKMKPGDLQEMAEGFAAGKIRKIICTYSWREGVSFDSLPHLIRADAGSSDINCIQIPGRLSRLSDGKEYGMLYDFMDTYSKWSADRAEKRIAQYRKQGWDVSCLTPI